MGSTKPTNLENNGSMSLSGLKDEQPGFLRGMMNFP
jgi:hypothetical protein